MHTFLGYKKAEAKQQITFGITALFLIGMGLYGNLSETSLHFETAEFSSLSFVLKIASRKQPRKKGWTPLNIRSF